MNDFLKKLGEYEGDFGDGFPTFMFSGYPEEETIAIIYRCIKEKKDVYDLGYLTLDDDIKY